MVILHVANITNNFFAGVNIAVSQYILNQQKIEKVALLNCNDSIIDKIKYQYQIDKIFDIDAIEPPFNNPDIVIFHEVYYPAFLKIAKKVYKLKIPYIIIPHGCLTYQAQRHHFMKKIIGNLILFNKFINNSNALQFLSNNEMNKSIKRKNGYIIYNGLETPRKKYQIKNNDEIKIVYIGSLNFKIKGIDLLLKSINLCKNIFRKLNVKLYIYGKDFYGSKKRIYKLINKLNIGDFVEVNNEISGSEKENVLLDADLFIQASRSEGMSLGLLEAFSYGIPCIITDGTNLGDFVIEYNSGWVSKTNYKSLTKCLIKALGEKNIWGVKSKNALMMFQNNFEINKITKQTIQKYISLSNLMRGEKKCSLSKE